MNWMRDLPRRRYPRWVVGIAFGAAIVIAVVGWAAVQEYKARKAEDDSLAPGDIRKWEDPNYKIITAGAYNYTDYEIGPVVLLPPEKNDIEYGSYVDTPFLTRLGADRWRGGPGGMASMAWDFRWALPKKFKVWWFRVVDEKLAKKASESYDQFTMKDAGPGGAWCESEVVIHAHPTRDKGGGLILHFYPDGLVEGEMDISTDTGHPRVDLVKRNEQPRLVGRSCLREIQNPFYGKKSRSVTIN